MMIFLRELGWALWLTESDLVLREEGCAQRLTESDLVLREEGWAQWLTAPVALDPVLVIKSVDGDDGQ